MSVGTSSGLAAPNNLTRWFSLVFKLSNALLRFGTMLYALVVVKSKMHSGSRSGPFIVTSESKQLYTGAPGKEVQRPSHSTGSSRKYACESTEPECLHSA